MKSLKNDPRAEASKIFMRGYENLNKVRKILKSLCEVTKNLKSDARTETI